MTGILGSLGSLGSPVVPKTPESDQSDGGGELAEQEIKLLQAIAAVRWRAVELGGAEAEALKQVADAAQDVANAYGFGADNDGKAGPNA
jgi:hypothetical protein